MNVIINYQQCAIRFSTRPSDEVLARPPRRGVHLARADLFVDSPRGVERLAR